MDFDKLNAKYDKRNEKEVGIKRKRPVIDKTGLLPLRPDLEKMLEDSWNDNEELYRALGKEQDQ